MPKFKINFTEAGDNPGEHSLIPAGVHNAVCVKVELGHVKDDPGRKFFAFTIRFPEHEGKELVLRNMLNAGDKNTYLKSSCKALGQAVKNEVFEIDTDKMAGKKIKAKVAHVQNQGRGEHAGKTFTNDEIKLLYSLDGGPSADGGSSGSLDLTGSGGGADLSDIPF